jgi:hypothetical protein
LWKIFIRLELGFLQARSGSLPGGIYSPKAISEFADSDCDQPSSPDFPDPQPNCSDLCEDPPPRRRKRDECLL